MHTARIIRKYRTHAGAALVGWEMIALPYLRVRVRMAVYEHNGLPPIDEACLRILGVFGSGGTELASIGTLLGLEFDVVEDRVIELRRQEWVRTVAGTSPTVALTERGQAALARDGEERPKVIEMTFDFCGVSRVVTDVPETDRLVGKAAKATFKDCRQIPLPRGVKVTAKELSVKEVQTHLEKAEARSRRRGKASAPRRVVAVQDEPVVVGLFYRQALLLAFQRDEESPRLEVVVNGEIESLISDAIAPLGIAASLKEEILAAPTDLTGRIRALGLELDDPAVSESLEADAAARQAADDVDAIEERLEETDEESERRRLSSEREQAEKRLADAELRRIAAAIRLVEVDEMSQLFAKALQEAKKRLLIESATVSSSVVNDSFLAAIRSALSKGVEVVLAVGMPGLDEGNARRRVEQSELVGLLQRIQQEFPSRCTLFLGKGRKSHAKHLVVDDLWLVEGGMNWLSNIGRRATTRNYNHEGGTAIQIPRLAVQRWNEVVTRYKEWGC